MTGLLIALLMIQEPAGGADSLGVPPVIDSTLPTIAVYGSDSLETALVEFLRAATQARTQVLGDSDSIGLQEVVTFLGGVLALLTAFFGTRTAYYEFVKKDAQKRDKAAKATTIVAIPLGFLVVFGLIAVGVAAAALLLPAGVALLGLAAWAYVAVALDARYGFLGAYFGAPSRRPDAKEGQLHSAAARLSSLIPDMVKSEGQSVTLRGDMGNNRRRMSLKLLSENALEPHFDLTEHAVEPCNISVDLEPPPGPRIGQALRVLRFHESMALVTVSKSEDGAEDKPFYWPLTSASVASATREEAPQNAS